MTGGVQARAISGSRSSVDALNELNIALEKIISPSNVVGNGTSTALNSAAVSSPSATGSQADISSFTPSLTSSLSESVKSTVVSSTTGEASVASASQRSAIASAGSSEQSFTITKKAAISSAPASSAASSAILKTNAASSTAQASSSSEAPAPSSHAPAPAPAPSSSSDTPKTTSSGSKASTSEPAATSSVFTAISTQRDQPSSEVSSSSPNQSPNTSSSSVAAQQSSAANAIASAQPNDSSPPSTARQTSSDNTATGGPQVSSSGSSSPLSSGAAGNSLIGVNSGSSSTVHADTTLATARAITVTSGSSTLTTTPQFITSISVSSGSNGTPPKTFTSILANPTIVSNTNALSGGGFFNNKGAVAGVFTVLALIILAIISGSAFFCCRRRRQRSTHMPSINTQFRRFSAPPDMSQRLPTTYQASNVYNARPTSYRDDPQRHLMAPSIISGQSHGHEDALAMQSSVSQASHHSSEIHPGTLGLTGVLANPAGNAQEYSGPFSDYHRYIATGDTRFSMPPGGPVGMAFSSDFEAKPEPEQMVEPEPERREPSPAPSSPSIYPPSLPAVPEKDEDDYLFYERETKRRPESYFPSPPPKAVINDADPRNPFTSPFDSLHDPTSKQDIPSTRVLTGQTYRPLTPPDSSSGHSSLPTPTSPTFLEAEDTTKQLNPFSNAFLGRPVSTKIEPLARPKRNPLRLSASGASLQG